MPIEKPEWLEQIEGLLESLNEGVIILDDCSRVIFVNSCFEETTGHRAEDVIGLDGARIYSAEEYSFIIQQRELNQALGRVRYEFVVPHKDGRRIPVIISARRVEDPDGRLFAIVTLTDISDQKKAESQLRDANAKLEERQLEIEQDLALAARVQQSLAPKSIVWGNVRVDTYFHPVRTIGGDFGLVSPLDDDHLNLLVCDVSGHGITSALVANRIYSEIFAQLQTSAPLGSLLKHLNRFVMQTIGGSGFFFTLAAARLERRGRQLVFAGAGHPPAMIVTPSNDVRLLESRSMVLGAIPDAVDVHTTTVDLDRGDRIVLYTDGITDVFDAHGEILGVSGVEKFVREAATLPFAEMTQGILDRVAAWQEGPSADDVSLVVVEVL